MHFLVCIYTYIRILESLEVKDVILHVNQIYRQQIQFFKGDMTNSFYFLIFFIKLKVRKMTRERGGSDINRTVMTSHTITDDF
jgi:hypothetical protein